MKLLLEIELECDEASYPSDPEEMDWLVNYILMGKSSERLILHSNEIGDEVGTVKVLKVTEPK